MDIDKNQKIKNIFEKWTKKYKESINCSDPKGFSQRAHCQGKKKKLTEDLRRWFKEKWTAQDGSECGGYKGRGRVKCRPSKRVSSGTPQTWGEMSKKEKIKAVRLKQKAHKKGKQFSSHRTGKTWGGSGSKYQPTNEDFLTEKNIPTDSDLWSRAKSLARSKFDVYPCVTMDSLAITRNGPESYHNLVIGDEILTYNIQNDELEWKPILNLHHFDDAPIVEMGKATGFKIKCTPNHKWVVKSGSNYQKTGLVETKDINKHMQLVCCSELNNSSDLILENWSKKNSWTEKVLSMSKEQREIFLASAIVYDGHDQGISTKIENRHTFGFSQKNEDHFYAAILAASLNGYHVSFSDKYPEMKAATIIRNKKTHNTQNLTIEDAGTGEVWCPETENNTWVMIQNGFVTITGNSAYANAWAAKWYKKRGGSWKTSMKENIEYISEDFLPLIEEAKNYLLETYTIKQINTFTDEELINELFGGAGLVGKIASNTQLQQQLGGLAAAQAMKSKGAQQAFIGDVRASLRGEAGIKGFLTRNIKGVENLRLKRRVDALKAITASPDKASSGTAPVTGSGSFAAQQQRKAYGPLSVEKDLVRQAGAEAIKQKAETLIQRDPQRTLTLATDIMNKRIESGSKFSYGDNQRLMFPQSPTVQQRIERIRQTGLGPKSLYQPKSGQEPMLTQMMKIGARANLDAAQVERNKRKLQRDQDQEAVLSRLAARDADVDTSSPAKMFKPKRALMSIARRKPPSKNILKLIRKYVGESLINEVADKSSMKCNKPRPSTSAGKKMMVKACEDGKEKIVHFGAKGYGHNYSKAARKSFRARHKCDEPKSKLSAQYWACKKLWAGKGGSTAPCPEGRQCKESVQINNNIITEANMKFKNRSTIIKEALSNFKRIIAERLLSEEIVNPDNVPMTKREQVVRDNIAKKRKLRKWCKPIKGKDNAKNAYHRCATFIVMKMRGGKKGAGALANKTKGKTKKSKSRKTALQKAETAMKKRERYNVKRRAKRAAAREAKKGSKD